MDFKTIAALGVVLAGGWYAAERYDISLDPRDHLPTEAVCYVDKRILHIDQMNSFNIDRTPRITRSIRFDLDRTRFHVSDSYSPDGASLRDIEIMNVTRNVIEIEVRPGVLKNLVYTFRSPSPDCAGTIKSYFSLSAMVLPRIVE